MDVESVFRARSRTLFDFLTRELQACRIPAYQRGYSWDKSNVKRLMEDATLGLHSLTADKNALRFLGSVITIKAPPPEYHNRPTTVYEVVDGQQRICTVAILNALVHAELARLIVSLKLSSEQCLVELAGELSDLSHQLAQTYTTEPFSDPPLYRYYPRITRELEDQWGRNAQEARYESPVARFIWKYIEHTKNSDSIGDFEYDATDSAGNILQGHEALIGVVENLTEEISAICEGRHTALDLPDVRTLRTAASYQQPLLMNPPPAGLEKFMSDAEDDNVEFLLASKAIRLSALVRFINHRMVATHIDASGEDYAFDLFEALNTTGQPLTAFETFVPKVVEMESPNYATSESRESVGKVQEYLDRFDKAEDRQNATSTLLIPFALSENGHKLEKHLSQQRKYLRDRYTAASDRNAKRAFVRHLAHAADFVSAAWRPAKGVDPQLLSPSHRDTVADFCFEALRTTRHEITLAPLVRFYATYREAKNEVARKEAAIEFFEAVKAVTAFSMVWRAAKGNTANIDSAYRDLMANSIGGAPALSRGAASAGTPKVADLRTALLNKLSDAKIDRKTWVKDASQASIYKVGQGVTRFLVLVAVNNTIRATTKHGFYRKAKKGTLDLLSRDIWRDEKYLSVEHVAPESRDSAGWPTDVYDDQRTVQRLGNFVLMPSIENSMLGNKSFDHKKLLYTAFGVETKTAADKALAKAKADGFTPSNKLLEHLADDPTYLHMCASIMKHPGPWDLAYISERSEHLAELAWDEIFPWISGKKAPPAKSVGSKPLKKGGKA